MTFIAEEENANANPVSFFGFVCALTGLPQFCDGRLCDVGTRTRETAAMTLEVQSLLPVRVASSCSSLDILAKETRQLC